MGLSYTSPTDLPTDISASSISVGSSPTSNNDASAGISDIWMNGSCDESALKMAAELGWIPDLYAYKDLMCENSATMIDAAMNSLNNS